MRKAKRHIAVIVRPGAIHLYVAVESDGSKLAISGQAQVDWPDSSQPPDPAKLLDAMKEATGGMSGVYTSAIALHPSLLLCRSLEVPPAGRKEVGEYIRLWSSRQWPGGNAVHMRVAWRRIGQSKALVAVAKAEILLPIEEALQEFGASISWAGPETAALARFIPAADCWIALSEEDGTHLAAIEGNHVASQKWFPAFSEDALREEIETRAVPICLYSGDLRVGGDVRKPGWWRDKANAITTTTDDRIDEMLAIALSAIESSRHPDSDALAFTAGRSELEVWRARVESISSGKRGRTWIAILAAAVFLLLVAGGISRSRLYASAESSAGTIAFDEAAARNNIRILNELARERRDVLVILDALRGIRPESIRLEQFSFDARGNVSLSGMTSSYAGVEQFTTALNESRVFRDAVTQSTSPVDKDAVKFSIRCRLGRTL